MTKRIFMIIAAVVLGLTVCGCSKDEDKIKNEYEAPIRTMIMAIQKQDCESYLRCFATPIVDDYKQSETYNDNLAADIYSSVTNDLRNANSITFKVESKKAIEGEDLDRLCSDVRNGINIKMAYELELEVTVSDFSNSKSGQLYVTVGKIGSNWYICQSPVLEIEF